MGLTIVSTPTNHKHSRDDVDAEGGESSAKKRKVTNPKPQPDMMTVNIRIRIAPNAPLQTVSLEMAIPNSRGYTHGSNPFEKNLLAVFSTLQEYDIVIPSPVKTIPRYAFYHCQHLTTVKLPDTMNHIETSAFDECKKLHKINFPTNLKSIDWGALSDCPNLQDIHFPANVTCERNCYGFSGKDKKRLKTIRVGRSTLANRYPRVKRFLDTMFTKCSHVFCVSCCVKGGYLYDGEKKKNCPVCKTEQASSCIKVIIRP